jgi:hypothetical protein
MKPPPCCHLCRSPQHLIVVALVVSILSAPKDVLEHIGNVHLLKVAAVVVFVNNVIALVVIIANIVRCIRRPFLLLNLLPLKPIVPRLSSRVSHQILTVHSPDNLRHPTRSILTSRCIYHTCVINLVDHPLLPQRPHPQLEQSNANVKQLAESSASIGDVDDLNPQFGNLAGDRCHHVALVRVKEDVGHNLGRWRVVLQAFRYSLSTSLTHLSIHTSSIQAASWQAYTNEGSWCLNSLVAIHPVNLPL